MPPKAARPLRTQMIAVTCRLATSVAAQMRWPLVARRRPRPAASGTSQMIPVKVWSPHFVPATASSHPKVVHLGGSSLTVCCPVLASDSSKSQAGVVETLKRRARLWFLCSEGAFPPPDGPGCLEKITDELLVVASEVVASVADA